jgi:putative cell wall-binding protein
MSRTPASVIGRRTLAVLLTVVVGAAGAVAVAAPAQAADTTVSGHVSVDGGNRAGMLVEAFSVTGTDRYITTTTDSSSNYTLTLPADSYQIRYSSFGAISVEWLPAGASDAYTQSEAEVLTVGTTPLTGVDVDLVTGFSVTGTATLGARVTPFRLNTVLDKYEQYGSSSLVDSLGFLVVGLAPGNYIFRIGPDFGNTDLETKYFGTGAAQTYIADTTARTISADVTGVTVAPLGASDQLVTRLFGSGRFETSADIAAYGTNAWGTSAFLVSGRNFPDALSAGPLAGMLNAPVLLTEPNSVPGVILDALATLGTTQIFIIGGTASVSQTVEDTLRGLGYTVDRIAGSSRYETSQIAATGFLSGAYNAYVATGTNFPDALAAGPAAANDRGPVVLVPGSAGAIDSGTAAVFNTLGTKQVVVAGGTAGVSSSLASSLLGTSIDSITRADGTSRYETSYSINFNSFALADTIYLATGTNFPDALSGAALASTDLFQGPIFLTQSNCIPATVVSAIFHYQPRDIILLGGTSTLSVAVENLVPC